MAAECSIPVIDYLNFPNQSSKLLMASEEWGCFRLVNYHDILPRTLMSDMKVVVRSLLDLPVEIKRRNVDGIAFKGYMAPTAENPLYEALGLYDMASCSDVDNFCSQLDVSPQQSYVHLFRGVTENSCTLFELEKMCLSVMFYYYYYLILKSNGYRAH
ncbi:putative non-hem dioxygenase domain, isopenicillin N synthase [Helianthus anomalus]